jgi:hypothetical protein
MTQKIAPEHWRRFLKGTLPRPDGEDFFLFQIKFDSTDPFWDPGFNIVGDWKGCCRVVNAKLLAEPDQDRRTTLVVFQGDNARSQLLYDLREEGRYQQERQSIPNN